VFECGSNARKVLFLVVVQTVAGDAITPGIFNGSYVVSG
jgi:hypothetical protein